MPGEIWDVVPQMALVLPNVAIGNCQFAGRNKEQLAETRQVVAERRRARENAATPFDSDPMKAGGPDFWRVQPSGSQVRAFPQATWLGMMGCPMGRWRWRCENVSDHPLRSLGYVKCALQVLIRFSG